MEPAGISAAPDWSVYFNDVRWGVRKIDKLGILTTVYSEVTPQGWPATFYYGTAMTVAPDGTLYRASANTILPDSTTARTATVRQACT